MAMSRSLQEEEGAKARLLASGRQDGARQGRRNRRGDKKNRMMPPCSPPTLLLQDPEKARRQTEERVAWLLSEADEFPNTPPLPPSRLLALELARKASSGGPPSSLWECSSLVGLSAPGLVGAAVLTLPSLPGLTDQRPERSAAWLSLDSAGPEVEGVLLPGRGCGRGLQGKSPRREDAEGGGGALQDLMDLAGEGLTLTQWNPAAQQAEERGEDWLLPWSGAEGEHPLAQGEQERLPGDVPRSSLDLSLEKKLPLGSHSPPCLLGALAAAFKGMVNNPHLSDVQFQVDSGELFYAHMFVLYARCPQLMEVVGQKGFWVAEGEGKTRRVLLSDVSGEAAGVFLNYLYTAERWVPPHVLPGVAALAVRFGVAELAVLCMNHGWSGRPAAGTSGQEEEEALEGLLKSIWVGEEEEDHALLPEEPGREKVVVDEQELEEIYAFAATQRKAEEERQHSGERNWAAAKVGAELGKGSPGLQPSYPQLQDIRKEAVPSFLLGPPQDAVEQQPELAKASWEAGEESLLAVPWGNSLELFQQSYPGKEPSDHAAGEDAAIVKPPTPLGLEEKGLVPLSWNSSCGGSQGPLGALAETSPAWSKRRGGFCSDLSLTLLSPAPQEASGEAGQMEEQELLKRQGVAPARTAPGREAGSITCAPAPLPSSPPVMTLGSEEKRRPGHGEWQEAARGFPSKEWEEFGAMNGPLSLGGHVPFCQGRGVPLLGKLLDIEAGASGKRVHVPGPNNGRLAKLGLVSGPEAQLSGDAQDSPPTPKPSPKRQSLQGQLPLNHCSLPLRSSACLPSNGEAVAEVVVLDDSEEEEEAAAAAPQLSWGSSVLEAGLPASKGDSSPLGHGASPEGSVARKAGSHQLGSPPRPLVMRNGTQPGRSHTAGREPSARFGCAEEGSCGSDGSCSWMLDLGGQSDETEILPLTQRLPAPAPAPKTPDLVRQERGALWTTPLTPMPSYSIMETPVLKKELSRFGVRTLPKQQMVLKLKEIFQYTHQQSDSRGATAFSQPGLCHGNQAAPRRQTSAAAHSGFPKLLPGYPEHLRGLLAGGSSGAGDQGQLASRGCLPAGPRRQKRAAEGPLQEGQALATSQKADGLSGATRDRSVALQSSSAELETSTLAKEEDIPSSQSTCPEADMLVALRQHIRSRPALSRQVLSYQPFELARLQSELKQNGVRIALGRLLEFLDAHCITFTTAEARREKQQQSRSQGSRRRRY